MRALIQKVRRAQVEITGKVQAAISVGWVVLLGIGSEDQEKDADWLAGKIVRMRAFEDQEGKMNRDISFVSGDILVVSQFTLMASYKKGNRPSFLNAANPETALPLYNYFLGKTGELLGKKVSSGVFGADMQLSLVNDGPVTMMLDSMHPE